VVRAVRCPWFDSRGHRSEFSWGRAQAPPTEVGPIEETQLAARRRVSGPEFRVRSSQTAARGGDNRSSLPLHQRLRRHLLRSPPRRERAGESAERPSRLKIAGGSCKCVSEEWVARATRRCRSATRRPEDRGGLFQEARPYCFPPRSPFRPAGRRAVQASGLCYPKRISGRALSHGWNAD
jgi:hypothetical protein